MLFRYILTPLFGVSALLCTILGVLVIGTHIQRQTENGLNVQTSTLLSAPDGMLFLFTGITLTAMAILLFEAKSFAGLSEILNKYTQGSITQTIRDAPIDHWLPSKAKHLPATSIIGAPRKPFVFVSYSRCDDQWRENLTKWLYPSLACQGWDLWHDKRIVTGYEWTPNLSWAIENSSIAICLVSQDFVASPFISSKELPALRQRPLNDRFGIDWIPISEATANAVQLDQNQALWPPTQPLDILEPAFQRKALKQISDDLLKKISLVEQLAPDPPVPSKNS